MKDQPLLIRIPKWMIDELDKERAAANVSRNALVKSILAYRYKDAYNDDANA